MSRALSCAGRPALPIRELTWEKPSGCSPAEELTHGNFGARKAHKQVFSPLLHCVCSPEQELCPFSSGRVYLGTPQEQKKPEQNNKKKIIAKNIRFPISVLCLSWLLGVGIARWLLLSLSVSQQRCFISKAPGFYRRVSWEIVAAATAHSALLAVPTASSFNSSRCFHAFCLLISFCCNDECFVAIVTVSSVSSSRVKMGLGK